MHVTKKLFFAFKSIKKKIFMDSLRLHIKGGAGGNGFPKYGGIGGAGGDVYVVGKEDASLMGIVKKYPSKRIAAGQGENSLKNRIFGLKGKDLTIESPLGVDLYDQTGKKIGEINQEGDKYKVISGGIGGCSDTGFSGYKGESQVITFDLKLIADVGLVGFPNAGKSTLLSKISRARPKIASYPFTTLQPQLGIIRFKDGRQISVADLPGLIENAHQNFGMGHKFLKHIERTKLLLIVVDVEGFRLSPKYPKRSCIETILLLNKELELYRQELLNYPTMLIVNKMDKEGANSIYTEVCEMAKNLKDVFCELPESLRPEQPLEFQRIIGISATKGDNQEINLVQNYIREILDECAEEDPTDKELSFLNYFNSISKEKSPKVI